MKPVIMVVGTRPEAIKMVPVYYALKQAKIPVHVCATNQHNHLLEEVFNLFSIIPDSELHVMQKGQDLFHITTAVLHRIKTLYESIKPSLVLVQGDTTTAMAAALAAFYKRIPIAHIEAGLRTGDKWSPYPEETNREMIGLIADYHFAPTATAAASLFAEGKDRNMVFSVGNTVVDALRLLRNKIEQKELTIGPIKKQVDQARAAGKKVVLLTVHRRESLLAGVEGIVRVIKEYIELHSDLFLIYPFHPNPLVKQALQKVAIKKSESILLSEPLAYQDLFYVLDNSSLVITDSGGIQEEGVSLGKKVVVLRDKSERMEGVWQGNAQLVGTNPHLIKKILYGLDLQKDDTVPTNVYGDGYAADKIANILKRQITIDEEIYACKKESMMQKEQI